MITRLPQSVNGAKRWYLYRARIGNLGRAREGSRDLLTRARIDLGFLALRKRVFAPVCT